MARFALEYSLFVFVACLGVLQIAAARNRLEGLSLFPRLGWSYLFATLTLILSFGWFFSSQSRYQSPLLGGLEQLLFFSLSALFALAFTLTLVSALKANKPATPSSSPDGLEVLQKLTYLQALRRKRGLG